MKRYFLGSLAALGLWAGTAVAETTAEQVVQRLAERGYTNIQARQTGEAVHVEAAKDGYAYEYLYNAVTGEILGQEARRLGEDEDREDEDSDDGDDARGDRFDRGEDGNHGHGNSGGYDEDNPGRSHDGDNGRSDRDDRRRGDKPGRGNGKHD